MSDSSEPNPPAGIGEDRPPVMAPATLSQAVVPEDATLAATGVYVPSADSEQGTLPLPAKGALPAIPGYEVLSILGRGGMGIVYRARQIKANRIVALKMILSGNQAEESERARFRSEAESIARLQHPHIVQVFEVGEYQGQPFFSLEFCDGGSLSKQLHGTPLPPRDAARLVEVLAGAVHAAHQKGVIHRDLKPANILLASGGRKPPVELSATGGLHLPLANCVPKISDFGLAKKLDDAGQTTSGAIMGTPSYMAPEQARGEISHIAPAVDIYALGVILYELLTGRPPFRATTPVDTVLQVLHDEPVPPRRLQPRMPRDVETICLKCLQKDASRRYGTAEALAMDLGRFLRGEPIEARPVGPVERVAKWVRRRPAAASLLSIAAALPLIALLLAGWYLERQRQFNEDLQAERNTALEQKDRAENNEVIATQRKREADDQRDEATRQKKRAEEAYRDSQLRLMQMHVARGVRLMEDDDSFAALPWLVTALKEDPRDAATREMHRYRIGAILRQSPRLTRLFFHPANLVQHVEFSPDGSKLLTTCDDHLARIWDIGANKEVRSLRHIRTVGTAATAMFTRDGHQVLTVSDDQTVKVLDAPTGQVIQTIATPDAADWACFSPDGQSVLVNSGRTVRVWNARTGLAITPPLEHAEQIVHASFSPNGHWVATASKDTTVRIWDVAAGKPLTPALKHEAIVKRAAFSPDGKYLATTTRKGKLRLWEVEPEAARLVWEAADGGSDETIFSPDGSRLVTCIGLAAKLWDAKTGQHIGQSLPHKGTIYHAAFSPDGRWVATTSEDLTARVWDTATGLPVTPPLKHAYVVLEVAFSPDGRSLATGCYDGTARIWDLSAAKPLVTWSSRGGLENLSPDTRYAAALGASNLAVLLLDAKTGKEVWRHWLETPAGYASFSPDSRHLLACADKTAMLWEVSTSKESCPPLKHDSEVLIAAVSPDATHAATGCKDGSIHVWDLATGKEIHPPLRHTGELHSIQFSKDGHRLLTSGKDSKARVWDATTGQPISPFVSHGILELGIWRLNAGGPGWSPDSNRLATSNGFHVCTWDAATGQSLGPPLDHSGGVSSLSFSRDGSRLLSTSNDCTALQWDVVTGKRLTPAMRHNSFVDFGTYSPDGRRIATTDRTAAWMWDAATGLLLAPTRKAREGHLLRFSPDGSHLFRYDLRQPGMSIWDVSRDDRPLEDLAKLAKLLGSHQLDPNGGLIPLARDELRQLWQDLSTKYPQDFSISPTVVLQWAQRAEARGQYSQAIAYYDQLIALGGKSRDVAWPKRASAFARLQQWDKALADFERYRQQQPEDHYVWFQMAPLLLRLGDGEGYHRHCREMLQRFGQTRNQGIAEHIAKGCLLHAGTVEEIDHAADLMTGALRGSENHPQRNYFKVTMSLAEYRQGKFREAEQRLDPFLQDHGKLHWSIIVPGYLVLAMTQQGQGHIEKARATLKQATQLMDEQIPQLANAKGNWLDWLVCQLLREETEDLLKEKR